MSTALIAALRESCGYLEDDGYHQTARLMTAAADEIEQLNERVRVLELRSPRPVTIARRPPEAIKQLVTRLVFTPRQRRKT
jgi:hypothetical protein